MQGGGLRDPLAVRELPGLRRRTPATVGIGRAVGRVGSGLLVGVRRLSSSSWTRCSSNSSSSTWWWKSLLKASSLSTQKMANDITLATRTRTVVSRWPSEYLTEIVAGDGRADDGEGDAGGGHDPERDDFLHEVRPAVLAPGPLAVQPVGREGGDGVTEDGAGDLAPDVEDAVDDDDDDERHPRRNDRHHGVAEDLLPLVGVQPGVQTLKPFKHCDTLARRAFGSLASG